MKFLLKQLRLFFPFVFPMYDVVPGEGGNVKITAREYAELLKFKKSEKTHRSGGRIGT